MEASRSIATDEHGKTRNQNTQFRAESNTHPLGARLKVAVEFPYRNYSVFKTNPNQLMESKRKNKKKAQGEHQRIYIRRSIKKGGLRAFCLWAVLKAHGLRSMGLLFLRDER